MPSVAQALAAARAHIPAAEARLLLQHCLNASHAWLAAHSEQLIEAQALARFEQLTARRAAGEPIAQLVGEREFYGRVFRVSPAVLIPRPETELLVDLARERLRGRAAPRVLDLGTGSGVLAVSLALEVPGARVTATDLSPQALEVARDNAARLAAAVDFVAADWYAGLARERRQLIVSNPPYVAEADPHLRQGDLRFEPRMALASGPEGLDALRCIVAGAAAHLVAGGWLLVEHGYDQAAACRALFAAAGFVAVASWRDLAGLERVTGGRIPNAVLDAGRARP